MSSKKQASKNRQQLIRLSKTLPNQLENILSSKTLIKGSICEKRRKCGNPRCRCAHGELHSTKILSFSDGGKSHIIHLSKYSILELSEIERQVKEYQRFRKSRAKIVENFKQIISEINKLERSLLIDVNTKKGKNNDKKKSK